MNATPLLEHPPKPMRLRAWLWGAIEVAALWRARSRLRDTPR